MNDHADVPQCIDIEKLVLGSVLLDGRSLPILTEHLTEEMFFLQEHRVTFRTLAAMQLDAREPDPILVCAELERNGDLEAAGGRAYVLGLTADSSSGIPLRAYCNQIVEKHTLRQALKVADQIREAVFLSAQKSSFVIEQATQRLWEILPKHRSGFVSALDLSIEGYKHLEELAKFGRDQRAIDTGLTDLDGITHGLHPGNLVIIGARPSCGKSALCHQIAINAAMRCGKRVGLLTLEMSVREVYMRIIASEAEFNMWRLKKADQDDWQRMNQASRRLAESRLYVDDTPGLTLGQVRAKVSRLAIERGIDIAIIDYLGLMHGSKQKYESRVREMAEITAGLKALAKDLDIPIVAACQINREGEGQPPKLNNLRESGSIENDADLVMLLYRPHPHDSFELQIEVAKNRNGPCGTVTVIFTPSLTRISGMAHV